MKLTDKDIEEINDKMDNSDAGVFTSPSGIPRDIKTPVIYSKWMTASRGGSCWDDEDTIRDTKYYSEPSNSFEILDMVLEKIKPEISMLEYNKVKNLIQEDCESDSGYYGDFTDYSIKYIILEDLYKFLNIN